MTPALRQFIEARLPLPGVSAWAIAIAGRVVGHESYADWLPSPKIERAAASLALTTRSLRDQKFQPVRLSWIFEHIRIHLAVRPDGTCLVLFAENRPDAANASLASALEEFTRLA